jgi:sulfide:quinone oxidoreductase
MNASKMSDDFYVSGQITAEDVEALAKTGIRSIICNRPDGESYGQPDFAEIAEAAKRAGLSARHIPITPGLVSASDVSAFSDALKTMPSPILAYCRSGARSASLWSMSRN